MWRKGRAGAPKPGGAPGGPPARGADKVGRMSERLKNPRPQKLPPISFYQGDLRGLWALPALCGAGQGLRAFLACRGFYPLL